MQLGSQCFQESCLLEIGNYLSILRVFIEFLLLSCTESLGHRGCQDGLPGHLSGGPGSL